MKRTYRSLKPGEKVKFYSNRNKSTEVGTVVSVGIRAIVVKMIRNVEVSFMDLIGVWDEENEYRELEY